MAEEVEVKYLPGDYKSWDQTTEPWDSIRNAKPWEAFGNKGVLSLHVKETVELKDDVRFGFKFKFREKFFINDFKFEASHIVINDVNFVEDLYDMTDLKNLSSNISPLGYEPTRPLFPGEYTYKDAIVGIQMTSSLTGNKIGFYQAKLNVDVEDVVARGTADITSVDESNPTRILYKKKYYLPPEELMFHITAAEEPANVKVISKTDTYFEVMLIGINSNQPVTGTISWVSTGY